MAFETIGETLRQARLNKKISLDELQQITKIQKRYLEAIDNDDFDQLPGKFYVRAFIRQYAEAVGEDGNHLVDVFDGKSKLSAGEVIERPEPETVNGSRKAMHQEENNLSKFWTSLPVILLGLVALAIITVVGYMTWQDRQSDPIIGATASSVTVDGSVAQTTSSTKEQSETSSPTTESSTEEKKMTITAGQDTGSAIAVNIAEAKKPITLEFTATNRVWIGVLVDNAYVYQGTLAANETQSTQLPETAANATITLGAASNATIKVNGEEIPVNPVANNQNPKNVKLALQYTE
ncbi:MAG: helix-turn-helix domain-containing protein [Enterococcus lacertideformus]|uniref:Helix-turn-helix domain-containing protein n=1 Tax=Enterococcus lacertideformus TaxID=2771493 RepID=A0A931AX37_9ENTE|nr:helix-turn-helix domain-containing protein [Enterococcus lacertideformus]